MCFFLHYKIIPFIPSINHLNSFSRKYSPTIVCMEKNSMHALLCSWAHPNGITVNIVVLTTVDTCHLVKETQSS